MKLTLPYVLTAALVAPYGVSAWGSLGHQTTGWVSSTKVLLHTLTTNSNAVILRCRFVRVIIIGRCVLRGGLNLLFNLSLSVPHA